jgi:YHS domain-containing protein
LSEYLITRITRILAEGEGGSDRLYREPHAEVHVLGVPEGSYGVFGRVVGDSALTDMISDAVTGIGEVPEGMAVDPVCGATVRLDDPTAVTSEVEGTTYGFCCPACRRKFLARQHADAART